MTELTAAQRSEILVYEASRWLGIHELGGENRGQCVEIFQKSANIAPGDPWCLAFAQYCVTFADGIAAVLGSTSFRLMPSGASCMSVWDRSAPAIRSDTPAKGSLAIWRHKDSSFGHAGIVTDVAGRSFSTIEGNTSAGPGVEREGDGVYAKHRSLDDGGSMLLIGFILPWGK